MKNVVKRLQLLERINKGDDDNDDEDDDYTIFLVARRTITLLD